MARTKRSVLPPITEYDRTHHWTQIRSTPNGGWAWMCHYCQRYASDLSLAGRYLCRCHGGSTPRVRDPIQRALHKVQTGQILRWPGRPIKHGFYSRGPKISVAEVIDEYRARQARLKVRTEAEVAHSQAVNERMIRRTERSEQRRQKQKKAHHG